MSAAPPSTRSSCDDLDVAYRVRGVEREVLRGVSLQIGAGEAYGLVGESGCGKSTTALAVVRYLPRNGRVRSGSIAVAGADVLALGRERLRQLRAERLSMVYQNPADALNPSMKIGAQVAEVFTVRGVAQGRGARPQPRRARARADRRPRQRDAPLPAPALRAACSSAS